MDLITRLYLEQDYNQIFSQMRKLMFKHKHHYASYGAAIHLFC